MRQGRHQQIKEQLLKSAKRLYDKGKNKETARYNITITNWTERL